VEINIVNEVAALRRLSVAQLRLRFAELFGEASHASNRTWLTKRILWRMQALAQGDLRRVLEVRVLRTELAFLAMTQHQFGEFIRKGSK
jgi:hypothetical protein